MMRHIHHGYSRIPQEVQHKICGICQIEWRAGDYSEHSDIQVGGIQSLNNYYSLDYFRLAVL